MYCKRLIAGAGLLLTLNCGCFAGLIPIVNPSFEDRDTLGDGLGGTFGWTHSPSPPNGLGAVAVTTPDPSLTPPGGAHDGSFFIWGRATGPSSAPSILFQRLDVSSHASIIDADLALVDFTAYGLGDDTDNDLFGDFAQMRIGFFDSISGGSALGGSVESNKALADAVWTAMTVDSEPVPVGTRSVELSLLVNRPFGSFNDAGFDDVSGSLIAVPEPSGVALMVIASFGLAAARLRLAIRPTRS